MKIKVAILDMDIDYLKKITKVIENNYSDKMQIFSFTDLDIAAIGVKENKIDVFLGTEEFDINIKKLPKRCAFAYFTDSTEIKYYKDIRCVGKYQKVEYIYKQILSIYAECAVESGERLGESIFNSKIYTFISASGGVGSSTIAMAFARNRVRKGVKTLYLNLEQFGDISMVFEGNGTGDLSDIFYSIKSRKSNIRLKIESNIKSSTDNVYYYDSCNTPFDFLELTREEVKEFINDITASDLFECIILDIDMNFSENISEILLNSKKIILVNDGTKISNIKCLKAIEAFTIFEQQHDVNILRRIEVLYNKFGSKTGQVMENENVKIIGGIRVFANATYRQVVEEISELPVMEEI